MACLVHLGLGWMEGWIRIEVAIQQSRGGGVAVSIWKDAAAGSKTISGKVRLLTALQLLTGSGGDSKNQLTEVEVESINRLEVQYEVLPSEGMTDRQLEMVGWRGVGTQDNQLSAIIPKHE